VTLKIIDPVILTILNISAPSSVMESVFFLYVVCCCVMHMAACTVVATTVTKRRLGKHVDSTRAIDTQLTGKQVPAEMNTHAAIGELPILCNGEVNTPLQQ
jgi:hypothetical protein